MTTDVHQPIACILQGDELQDRLAGIAKLMRDALQGSERDDLTLRLRFAAEAVQRVQEMVHKEEACYGFLTFEVDKRPHEVWLTIRAPEAARAAADTLFAQFAPSAGPIP